jgi:RNA 3'-phosphate cyclase
MEELLIDGSYGEGGGQVLRTSLFLSTVLRKPIRVVNIRAGRSNPGLRPQHLATIRAFVEITEGRAENLKIGARDIRYFPGDGIKDNHMIDVGTAGSITLMLQALIPALSMLGRPIKLRMMGGTDTRWSPTFDYLSKLVIPLFNLLGLDASAKVLRRGYYPRGGGIVDVTIRPFKAVNKLLALKRDEGSPVGIMSVVSRLPRSVAERQADSALRMLREKGLKPEVQVREEDAISPGTSILVYTYSNKNVFYIGGDCIGEKGVPAEIIGKRAAHNFLADYLSSAAIDRHLADMVIPLISLAEGRSVMVTSELTGHITTNLHISKLFTGCSYSIKNVEKRVIIEIEGSGLVKHLINR